MVRTVSRRLSQPAAISAWEQHVIRRLWSGHRMMSSARPSRHRSPSPSTTQRSAHLSARRWTTSSQPPKLPTWPPAGLPDRLPETSRPRSAVPSAASTLRKVLSSRPPSTFARPTSIWPRSSRRKPPISISPKSTPSRMLVRRKSCSTATLPE